MTGPQYEGTARRQVGRTPRETPVSPASARLSSKASGAGDRWRLFNAIVDDLAWLPDGEYRVLLVLFRYAGEEGRAWPGQLRIATACECNRGTVSRRLARLARWGIIEVVRRGHKGSKKAAEYRIRLPSRWPTEKPPD
jgi:hypothetical protein